MRVRVLMGFCLGRSGDVHPGEVVELEERFARQRIREGRAQPAPETEPEDEQESDPNTAAMSGAEGGSGLPGTAAAADPRPQRGARGRKPASRSEA